MSGAKIRIFPGEPMLWNAKESDLWMFWDLCVDYDQRIPDHLQYVPLM